MNKDVKARNAVEHTDKSAETSRVKPGHQHPPAGPHAKEHLIDRDKTPGSGALPEQHDGAEVDAGTG